MERYVISYQTLKRNCKYVYPRIGTTMKFKFGCNNKILKRKKLIENPKDLNAHYRCSEINCPILKRLEML